MDRLRVPPPIPHYTRKLLQRRRLSRAAGANEADIGPQRVGLDEAGGSVAEAGGGDVGFGSDVDRGEDDGVLVGFQVRWCNQVSGS